MLFKTRCGILELLLQRLHLPSFVIQIFVAFATGRPSATWTGSTGSFSFDQKYIQYEPTLKI